MGATPADSKISPAAQRQFAVDVVAQLTAAGFTAYWAGGCVRDALLGMAPKDYDVATSATPDQIRAVFGRKRTLAIGASFGVITVLGQSDAGQIEVATFRRDVGYSDGRRPDAVEFSDAEEDARRRDFTINGMFFDPHDGQVIDYVGGQDDLQRQVLRAIGDPELRFAEDKLRMLRAVRFAAVLGFELETTTREAVERHASEIAVVSVERIVAEVRRIFAHSNRVIGLRLLDETGLLPILAPELPPLEEPAGALALAVLSHLLRADLPLALAALLEGADRHLVVRLVERWKLSNAERERTLWLAEHREALRGAKSQRWSLLQPVIVHSGALDLIVLHEARAAAGLVDRKDSDFARVCLARDSQLLNPTPLLSGHDLMALGAPQGPTVGVWLRELRAAQLDGEILDRATAVAWTERRLRGG